MIGDAVDVTPPSNTASHEHGVTQCKHSNWSLNDDLFARVWL